MYLSINFYLNNIYLYQKLSGPVLCKNNFAYNILDNNPHKITCLLSNFDTRDTISILNGQKLKLNINPMWGLKNLAERAIKANQPIKRNVLIPSTDDIELINDTVDLNPINCLCHDKTHIRQIPEITISIGTADYTFTEWTGNNQVWCSIIDDSSYYTYAYIYIFYNKSVLLISQTPKDPDNHQYFDLDLMSIYEHQNYVKDEYGRIDCNEYHPIFNDLTILSAPSNRHIDQTFLKIKTQCHTA